MAYSGENEALEFALASGQFDGVQCSLNICDQGVLARALPTVRGLGLGLIAKRPLANRPWLWEARPVGAYCEEYWVRLQAMGLDPGDLTWEELALRFSAFQEGIACCIVGTARLAHLEANVRLLDKGPLPPAQVAELRAAFTAHGAGWDGQI